jgi:nucleotide-binding universal stress UspA family protein
MRIIVYTDGSDDGLVAAQTVTSLIDPRVVKRITLIVVTWPERHSPLWDRAHDLQLSAHGDLHAAMAIAARQVIEQLRLHVAGHAETIDEIVAIGEPSEQLLSAIEKLKPAIVFVAMTSGHYRDAVEQRVTELTKQSPSPIVVMHAVAPVGAGFRAPRELEQKT